MNNTHLPKRVSTTPRALLIEWQDGHVSEFSSIWLRDNSPAGRDPANGQRLVDIVELPPDPRIESATLRPGTVLVQRVFAELLRDSRYQLRLRLRKGDLVAFDNRRILHGRTAFSSARSLRHLQGCYLTRDSVYSEAAMLHRKLADERHA